jgi:hypothetical protein
MTFSDTARSQLYYLKEVTWGVTPAVAMNAVRFTGETLNLGIDTTQSKEIRSDRQITDVIQTDAQPEGDVNFELSYSAFDDFFEAAFFNTWGTTIAMTGSTFAAVSGSPDSFTDSANGFVAAGILAGQWIKAAGFTNPANNGFFQVLTVAAGTITVKGETALVAESAAAGRTFKGANLRNGTTLKSFSMETLFSDVTKYKNFTGMRVSKMSLKLTVSDLLTGVLSFMGKTSNISATTIGTGGPVAAPTNNVLNSVNNIAYVQENSLPYPGKIQDFTMDLNNNLRAQKAVGTLGNVGIGSGRAVVTGKLSTYFEGSGTSLYSKYLAGTETSLALRFTDPAGNAYILTFPRVKLTKGTLVAGAADTDAIEELEYQAIRHTTYGFTVQLDRFLP